MPAKLAESDAAVLLERRRAQNRKAQQKFRLKRLAAEAEAKAKGVAATTASTTSSASSAKAGASNKRSKSRSESTRSASQESSGSSISSNSSSNAHAGPSRSGSQGSRPSSQDPSTSPEAIHPLSEVPQTLDEAINADRRMSLASSTQVPQAWGTSLDSALGMPLFVDDDHDGNQKKGHAQPQYLGVDMMPLTETAPFEAFTLSSMANGAYDDVTMSSSDYTYSSHDTSPSSFDSSRSSETSPSTASQSSPSNATDSESSGQRRQTLAHDVPQEARTADRQTTSTNSAEDATFQGLDWIRNEPSTSNSAKITNVPNQFAAAVTSGQSSDVPRELLSRLLSSGTADSSVPATKSKHAMDWWNKFWGLNQQPKTIQGSTHSSEADQKGERQWPLGIQIAQLATNEKGMLAICIFLSNEGTLEGLRRRPTSGHPIHGQMVHTQYPFIKAYYHNAITLGYLEEDLRTGNGNSNIKSIWARRGLDYQYSEQPPQEATYPWPWAKIPTALTETEEEFRMTRLRESTNLHPTLLQLKAKHSSIVDVLPWPQMRDTLISLVLAGRLDYPTMKCDLLGRPWEALGDGFTFQIHGDDPGDEEGWEMSEHFAQRYRPIIPSALIKRTNWWRRLRGQPNLKFDASQEIDVTSEEAVLITEGYRNWVSQGLTFFDGNQGPVEHCASGSVVTLPDDVAEPTVDNTSTSDPSTADEVITTEVTMSTEDNDDAQIDALTPPSSYLEKGSSITSNLFDSASTFTLSAGGGGENGLDTPTFSGILLGLDGAGATHWD